MQAIGDLLSQNSIRRSSIHNVNKSSQTSPNSNSTYIIYTHIFNDNHTSDASFLLLKRSHKINKEVRCSFVGRSRKN